VRVRASPICMTATRAKGGHRNGHETLPLESPRQIKVWRTGMIFVTGGAGFIGSNFVAGWLACSREPLLVIDSLTTPATSKTGVRQRPARIRLRAVGHLATPLRFRPCFVRTNRERCCTLRRRPTSIAPFSDLVSSCEPTSPARFNLLEDGASLLEWANGRRAANFPVPACLDRRGLRLARTSRPGILRNVSLRAQQPVFGVESRIRSSRACLSPHLRPADPDHQLQ